jgi:hypothetical protein
LRSINKRAHNSVLILRVANGLGLVLHGLLVLLDELVIDTLLDVHTGSGKAHLTGVGRNSVGSPGHSVVQVAIVENNSG